MVVRIVQGTSLGLFLSLLTGLVFGLIGLSEGILPLLLLQIITYLPAGYLAGKHEEHPYLSAGLSGACLVILNVLFALGAVGGGVLNYLPSILAGLTFGLILSLGGGLLSVLLRRGKEA